ncbi:MAG: tRNA lysidine(34) synthetase TilS [Candidatus Margulisbacteria bacterium]|jgi:tRNA(Ile)-lysidine synthase|nr:tRNA lysidine(34) synthetase TilS [Candidatus Margulisiibacteriota bacterium]
MNFKTKLFSAADRVLAAVSGGVDSVVLLHLLAELKQKLNFTLAAAHLNHQIRPEAGRDADFVKNLAAKYGLPFYLDAQDVPRLAAREGLSLEDAGRRARYAFFLQTARRQNYTALALAHHLDDQAETILFRLLRGAAAKGLSGIAEERSERGIRIVRPLLGAAKREILEYAAANALVFQEDATNQDNSYARNKLRNEILPRLRAINPNYQEGLRRTADILRDDDACLEEQAGQVYAEVVLSEAPRRLKLDAVALRGYPRALARRVVRLAVEKLSGALEDISLSFIENFLDNGLTALSLDENGRLLVSK